MASAKCFARGVDQFLFSNGAPVDCHLTAPDARGQTALPLEHWPSKWKDGLTIGLIGGYEDKSKTPLNITKLVDVYRVSKSPEVWS
jgi:hypothetical protein